MADILTRYRNKSGDLDWVALLTASIFIIAFLFLLVLLFGPNVGTETKHKAQLGLNILIVIAMVVAVWRMPSPERLRAGLWPLFWALMTVAQIWGLPSLVYDISLVTGIALLVYVLVKRILPPIITTR